MISRTNQQGLASLDQFKISSLFEHARFQSTFHCSPFCSSNISVFPGMHISITNIIRLKCTFKTFWQYRFRPTFKHRPDFMFICVQEVQRALSTHLENRNKPSEINEVSVGPIFLSEKGGVKSSKLKTIK